MQLSELQGAFERAIKALQDPKDLLEPVAGEIVAKSIPHTPRRSGALQESEHYELRGSSQAVLMADAGHALYVYEGTSRMEPRPFFDEGVEDALPDIQTKMQEWGGKVLDKVKG